MLLVAADEGVKPQTREHMEVLRSLGIRHGVVVVSKADLATPETLTIVREEIEELVRGTFLAEAPMVAVSARTGTGLDELRNTLLALARAVESRGRAVADSRSTVFHEKGSASSSPGAATRERRSATRPHSPLHRTARVRDLRAWRQTPPRRGGRTLGGLAGTA
jgi:translation initiation factor 2 gamma subunit (eIF-2gamma)